MIAHRNGLRAVAVSGCRVGIAAGLAGCAAVAAIAGRILG